MKKLIAITVLGTLLISCSHHKKEKKVTEVDALSDAQVSRIVTTANDGEILLAQYIISHSKNKKVKDFAHHMISDHTMNTTMTRNIAQQEHITQEPSTNSEEMQMEEETTHQEFMSLKGHDLDVAYMDDQVKTHEKVLSDLNTTLIPETKDSELRAHLMKTAEKVQTHLEHARAVRATL